jgi:IclR family pca regulon transcriptional regulator
VPRRSVQVDRFSSEGELLPSIPTLTESRYSQSLERGLAILSCFTLERPICGISDIADDLGMSRSTTHRYMRTLVELGYLQQQTSSHKYHLTLGVTRLGMSAMSGTSLLEHAESYLVELRDRTGFAVTVGVLDGLEVLLVDRLRGTRRGQHLIDVGLERGARLPVYCTAIGKLLLAYLPESEQGTAMSEMDLIWRASNTIASKRELLAELRGILGGGLAVADEELAPGLYSIAAPVRSATGETVTAVGMDAHCSMIPLEELVDALGPHLVATADRISARLGYRRADERHSPHIYASGVVEARREQLAGGRARRRKG